MIFDTFGSDFDTLLAIYTGDNLAALTLVAASDDSTEGIRSRTGFSPVPGTTYHIAVDGYEGEEGAVLLNWQPTVSPANDDLATAILISGESGSVEGPNLAASAEAAEPAHADNPPLSSVWWQWTAPTDMTVAFDTFGSDFDTVIAIYTGSTTETLTLVVSDDDSPDSLQSSAAFSATAGVTYQIAVDGYRGEQGTITLNWRRTMPPANDQFAAATILTGASGSLATNNSDATKEPNEPDHADSLGGVSIWWRWTAPASGPATFDTLGSEIDTVLAVYTGDTVDTLTLVASNDDYADVRQSQVDFIATAGATYRIAVDGYRAEHGPVRLNWNATPPAAELRILQITRTGAEVQIDFSIAIGDPPSAFELHRSPSVNGPYLRDSTATFSELTPGSLRVLTPLSSGMHFFRINRP